MSEVPVDHVGTVAVHEDLTAVEVGMDQRERVSFRPQLGYGSLEARRGVFERLGIGAKLGCKSAAASDRPMEAAARCDILPAIQHALPGSAPAAVDQLLAGEGQVGTRKPTAPEKPVKLLSGNPSGV